MSQIKINLDALKNKNGGGTPPKKESIASKTIVQEVKEPSEVVSVSETITKSELKEKNSLTLASLQKPPEDIKTLEISVEHAWDTHEVSFEITEDTGTKQEEKETTKKSSFFKKKKQQTTKETEKKHILLPNENGEYFEEYESDFEKNADKIAKKMRLFEEVIKTRISFLVSIVLMTVLWIGMLFYLNPEQHSFSVYKASLIYFYESKTEKSEDFSWTTEQNQENSWNPIQYKIKWYHFDYFETQEENNSLYKYKGRIYQNEKDLLNAFAQEFQKMKNEKIIEYVSKSS